MKLYDASTVDFFQWPKSVEVDRTKEYLIDLLKNGSKNLINNVDVEVKLLHVDDLVLPVTIGNLKTDQSYVASPFDQYVSYAKDELKFIKTKALKYAANIGVKGLEQLLKLGKINKVVIVNNWLISTNLYPEISEAQIKRIKDFIVEIYPNHAVLFRSIDNTATKQCFQSLRNQGFKNIFSRVVYMFDATNEESFKARMFKSDLKVLNQTEYEIVGPDKLKDEDAARLAELYYDLNVRKYSAVNPQYTEGFFRHAIKSGLLELRAWKKDGQIDAVLGFYTVGNVMTAPVFGYDTALSQDKGLYRQISTLLALEAKTHKKLLHGSGGGGSYKRLRRQEKEWEYLSVYHTHLPFFRRFSWKLFEVILNGPGKLMMKYFEP